MTTKPRGGGAKGLGGRATKKRTFFYGFPKIDVLNNLGTWTLREEFESS